MPSPSQAHSAGLGLHAIGNSTRQLTQDSGGRRLLVLLLICGAALPLNFESGAGFSLSPADFAAALLLPYVLASRHKSPDAALILTGIFLSVVGLLIFALVSPGLYPVLTAAFFWKSWIFYLAAYKWVISSRDMQAQIMKLLKGVGLALWAALAMTVVAWQLTGSLVRYSTRPDGTVVLGYSAGTWERSIQLYGYGQVNNTGALFVVGMAIFLVLTLTGRGGTRVMGVTGIVMSMAVIAPSGSRGSLVAALLLIVVAFASRFFQGRRVSAGTVLALGMLVAVTAIFVPQVIADTPKYLATLDALTSPSDQTDLTHGRGDLIGLMWEDFKRSPVVGTGFGDFARFRPNASEHLVNSSPHNTYIGPFHKGGVLVGVVYIALLIRALPLRRSWVPDFVQPLKWPLVAALALALFLVTDALTTSVLAAVTLTVLGVMRAVEVGSLEDQDRKIHANG